MKLEDEEFLKKWVSTTVLNLTDAEPNSLAKYVVAMLRNSAPNEELKNHCIERLNVFLNSNTEEFVENLFDFLKTMNISNDSFSETTKSSVRSASLKSHMSMDDGVEPPRIFPPMNSGDNKENVSLKLPDLAHNRFHSSVFNDTSKAMEKKGRCIHFFGQGYCMSGDLCQYDHGEDPVVMKLGAKPNYMGNPNLLTPPAIENVVDEYNPEAPALTPSLSSRNEPLLPTPAGPPLIKNAPLLPTPANFVGPQSGFSAISHGLPSVPVAGGGTANYLGSKTLPAPTGMISMSDHHQILTRVIQHLKNNPGDAATIHTNPTGQASQRSRPYHYPVNVVRPRATTNLGSSSGHMSFFPVPPFPTHQHSVAAMAATIIASADKSKSPIAKSAISDAPEKSSFFHSSLPIKSSLHENESDLNKSNINWLLEIYRRRVELYQRQLEEQRLLLLKITKATSSEQKRQLQDIIARNDSLLNTMKEEIKTLGEQLRILRLQPKTEINDKTDRKPSLSAMNSVSLQEEEKKETSTQANKENIPILQPKVTIKVENTEDEF